MIQLNRNHAKYDLPLEILCSLQCTPVGTDLFAKDFGVSEKTILSASRELVKRGFPVVVSGDVGFVCLSGRLTPEERATAESYFNDVCNEAI